MLTKISHKEYYQTPTIIHSTGDIWRGLPTFGLLKHETCTGLVITPACDLANHKVETVTYLPVVEIDEFLVSRSFYPLVLNKILNLSNTIASPIAQEFLLKNSLPTIPDIDFVISEYKKLNNVKKDVLERVIDGLLICLDICSNEIKNANKTLFEDFFSPKENMDYKERLIKNSFSNDLHFLPADKQDQEWSIVQKHSVVLFRYPLTVPIELLDNANDASIVDWATKMDEMSRSFPIANEFKIEKPLKGLRLHNYFLTDLLTRFAALYIRVGSPDFNNDTVKSYLKEI